MSKLTLLGISVVAVLALGACGDDGGPTPDAAASSDAAGGGADAPTGNQNPVASFTMSPTCTSSVNEEITFTSTSTDPDGDTVTCSWVFNAGTPGTSAECTATGIKFPNVAPYPVTLTVSDGNGGTATAEMSIGPC